DLIIASNSLNELQDAGRRHLGAMLADLADSGIAVVIEPGAEKNTHRLMRWRRDLVLRHPELRVVGPCGHSSSSPLSAACATCWNARRESLHQPLLYKRFRELASQSMKDDRPFHDFE